MQTDVAMKDSAMTMIYDAAVSSHGGDQTENLLAAVPSGVPGNALSPRKKKDDPAVSWESNVQLHSPPKDSRVFVKSGESTGARPCTPLRSRPASAGRVRPDTTAQRRSVISSAASPTAPQGSGAGLASACAAANSSSPTSTPRFMAPTKASTVMTAERPPQSPSNSPTILFVRTASFNSKATEQEEQKLKKQGHHASGKDGGKINEGETTGARPCTPLRSRPASAGRVRPDTAAQRRSVISSAASPTAPQGSGAGLASACAAANSSSPTSTPRFMAPTKASTAAPYLGGRTGSSGLITRSSSDLASFHDIGLKRTTEKITSPSNTRESDRFQGSARSNVVERLLKCPEKHKDWCIAEQKKKLAEEAKILTFTPDLRATSAHNRRLTRSPSSPDKSGVGGVAASPTSAGSVFDRLSRITTASLSAEHYTSPPPSLPFSGDSILDDAAISNLPNLISDPFVSRKRQ